MEMGQKAVIPGHFCQGAGAASPRPAGKNSANAQMGAGKERERQLILGGNKWGSRESGMQGVGVGCCSGCACVGCLCTACTVRAWARSGQRGCEQWVCGRRVSVRVQGSARSAARPRRQAWGAQGACRGAHGGAQEELSAGWNA